MDEKAVIIFITEAEEPVELEVPLRISASELLSALGHIFHPAASPEALLEGYLAAEHPFAFLAGSKSLEAFGVRNGTVIRYLKEDE